MEEVQSRAECTRIYSKKPAFTDRSKVEILTQRGIGLGALISAENLQILERRLTPSPRPLDSPPNPCRTSLDEAD